MTKYVEYPKWKYAKAASGIDKPRAVMVANADQEAALDGEWYDTADFRNVTREEAAESVQSNIPAGYVPAEYPKWRYAAQVPGGRMVHNRAEEDALEDAYPGVEWADRPDFDTTENPQLKSFGSPEDTGLNPNDPMAASDPVKLEDSTADDAARAAVERSTTNADDTDANTLESEQVASPKAKAAVEKNKAAAKKTGEDKAAKSNAPDKKALDDADLL